MPVSPADFALWARATGNKYPETAEEKIAAAPHAYEYARNLGRTGQNPPSERVGGNILYRSPESVQDSRPNSVFNAPVTPDNDALKVHGVVDNSLTSEHFVNQEQTEAEDHSRTRQLIDTIGKTALAAGAVAAGVALARNPGVQQAVRNAGATVKEGAQDISSRVSSFLGGLGGQEAPNANIMRTSGDITPPTTGQRYQQEQIPGLTKFMQQNKAAQAPPVTQSEVISTSQTFSPNNQTEQLNLLSHTTDPWTGEYTPVQTQPQTPKQLATVESTPVSYTQPEIPNLGPALTRKQEVIADVLSRMPITDYEREYTPRQSFTSGPVSKEVLQSRIESRRQELNALDQQRAELQAHLQAPSDQLAIPGLGLYSNTFRVQAIDPTTGEILHPRLIETTYSPETTTQPVGTQLSIPFDTATAAPSVGERTATFLTQKPQPNVQIEAPASEQVGYARYHPNSYEVSSRGDKRFSAMYARLPSGQTIEQAYQTAKGTGKGQPAADPNFDYWGTYKGLWNEYFNANPAALTEIANASQGKVLTDQFANTSNNQARAIHEILTERGLRGGAQPSTNVQPQAATAAPSVGTRAESFIQSVLPSAERQYQYVPGKPMAEEGFFSTVKYGGRKFAPDVQPELSEFVSPPITENMERTVVVPRAKEGPSVLAKVMQRTPGYVPSETVTKRIKFVQPFEEATVNRALIPGASRLVKLPGARDIEAAIATQEAQGTLPSGPYSSLLTQQQYQPATGAVSGVEPRLMTSGEQGSVVMTPERQERLGAASKALNALEKRNRTETDPGVRSRTNTFIKQIHGLHELTQDPSVLEAGAQMAMPIQVTLPGGEVAATSTLFKPFGAVEAQPGSVTPKSFLGEGKTGLTQMQGLTSDLIEHTQRLNAAKKQAYNILGVDVSNYKASNQYPDLTEEQFMSLPPPVQSRLEEAHLKVGATQNKLDVAKQFPLRYGMDKSVVSGFKYVPVVSAEQEVVGMRPVPEEQTMGVLERYKLASGAGASRIDVGGVGRRREELQAQYGQSLSPTESLGEPTSVLYKQLNPETNQFELVHPDDVSAMDIIAKRVIPVTGQAPSAQRLLGQGDRPYRGLEPSVISTASFDPAQREAILAARPELQTPEGLIYAPGAMVSPGGGLRPTMGTRFDVNPIPPAPAGSARAERVGRVSASEAALRQAGLGRMSPKTQYREITSRPTTRPVTAAEKAFGFLHKAISDWGGTYGPKEQLPDSQTIPLESSATSTPIFERPGQQYSIPGVGFGQAMPPSKVSEVKKQAQLNDLLAKYTGRSLQDALLSAQQREAATQLNLF